jgi:cell division protein FtsZ
MKSSSPPIVAYSTVIKIMGAGGGGNKTIDRLDKAHFKEVQTVGVNTDAQDLLNIRADQKILIGKNLTGGLGAGSDPEIGERAAEESHDELAAAIDGTDLLFLTCGLGGGTGTGSIPVIAKIAREMGTLTVAIVTMPFSEEGVIRWENAQLGLDKLKKFADSVIVLKNDNLADLFPDLPFQDALKKGDEIIINALSGIASLVFHCGLINLDFADISMILRDGPNAVIGMGESNSENRAEEAAKRAITHPMMNLDIRGAQSALIHVAGGHQMTVKETRQIVRFIAQQLDPGARIIWGVTLHRHLAHTIRVTCIITGLVSTAEPEVKKAETDKAATLPDSIYPIEKKYMQEKPQSLLAEKSIFDIKDAILASGNELSIQTKPAKAVTKTTQLFYQIFEDEVKGDLNRFDRAILILYRTPENRRALLDAHQASKLVLSSAQMFGFDEIGQLLLGMDGLLTALLSKEIPVSSHVLDSLKLAMDTVKELIKNRNDGKGETGFIVDRLKEIKNESAA